MRRLEIAGKRIHLEPQKQHARKYTCTRHTSEGKSYHVYVHSLILSLLMNYECAQRETQGKGETSAEADMARKYVFSHLATFSHDKHQDGENGRICHAQLSAK